MRSSPNRKSMAQKASKGSRSNTRAPKAKSMATITVRMGETELQAVLEAAKAEGESVEEFIYGGACLRLSQDLRVLERFSAGFPLAGADVQRLNQLVSVRNAIARDRGQLNKVLTHLFDSKRRLHREHEQALRDEALGRTN